ncbi:dipeptidase [Priestia koreensis]|uniref:dipeptidase n=1 Tax=Priestia koreensis TaxID=284581 RepID=UPI0034598F1F
MTRIFDMHCDVLMKLWWNPHLSFNNSNALHINYKQLKETGAKVQLFAIYIPEAVKACDRFDVALEMVELFHSYILSNPHMKMVKTKRDIDMLKANEIGAMLTIEGCDMIGDQIARLKTLFRLGVRSVGLTWNYSNAVADGILEERGAGLSSFGKRVVQANNEAKIWTDVSHLSVKGFWDVIEHARYPIASHSNVYDLCKNPRNLNRDQIEALLQRDSVIGITFVPEFLSKNQPSITDVIRHVEYICMLGGERNIGFGSDFDGIDQTTSGLASYKGYEALINELVKYYSTEVVEGFLFGNFYRALPV